MRAWMPIGRFVVLAVLLWLPACGAVATHAGTERQRPNIVLLVADDLGWSDIGYHNPQIRTPQLDRLATRGVELDAHYVMPQCTPTRVALLTGRYPSRYGRRCTQASNAQALPPGTLTMASMLRGCGYETALTGKWHLGSKPEWGPNHYGFDRSHGSLAGAVGMYDHRYRLNSPFARTWHRDHEFIHQEGHATDLVAQEAVRFIERKRDQPFFLYVPFHAVHTPIVEEQRWLDRNAHLAQKDRRLFAAALTHLDHAVGRIVAALEKSGQIDRTLILFMSDNGGLPNYAGGNYPPPDPPLRDYSSNAPLRGRKTDVYEGGIRVPAFAYWRGVLRPAKVTSPLHAVDWMPTLAGLVGYRPSQDPAWDGLDVWPALRGGERIRRRLYWVWGARRQRVGLRQGDWKLVRNGHARPWQLFDLARDPNEQEDLAARHPERVRLLLEAVAEERAADRLE